MVDFAGWEMPVEYQSLTQEHLAVRTRAGLFDVSHMGEIEIRGPEALNLLQWITSNDVSRLQDFQAQYSALMAAAGNAVDDCIVHRLATSHYFLCVNAANTQKDFDWLIENNSFDAEVVNVSSAYSQLALQGPQAQSILARVTTANLPALRTYWFGLVSCAGVDGILARTGYTGEDGFEFYFPPQESERVWGAFLEAGKSEGLIPAGLGARNTLRLEAGYPLYGNELDDQTTLIEANLGWICKFDKGDFLGGSVLLAQKEKGATRKLVGFEMTGPGIARGGYAVFAEGRKVGRVTSGSYAPYLRKSIGLAYGPREHAEVGREFLIEIRGKPVAARQIALPFYKRAR